MENPYLSRAIEQVWEGATPKQFVFLTYPAREMMFGGAVGGGKSLALLVAALQFVTIPGYAALLLRRTFADLNLPKALIPLSHLLLQGTDAQWDGQKYQWTFPSSATLSFGYLATEIDKYRYQGSALQGIFFDELTQFTESQYTYLMSRLRKPTGMSVPLRMRAASNPGGIGHVWVKDRFIDPRTCKDRVFVPSKLEDNPHLDKASYEESLAALDHITRRQLRFGDWEVRPEGNAFKSEWFRYYKLDDDAERYDLLDGDGNPTGKSVEIAKCTRFASADIAGTEAQDHTDPDYTVIQVWDVTPHGDMILVYQWRGRFEIPDVEEKLLKVAWDYEVDIAVVEKNGIGLGVVQTVKRRGLTVKPVVAKRDKYARSHSAQIRMEAGSVFFPRHAEFIEDLEAELLIFPTDGQHDDQVDALSMASQHVNKIHDVLKDERDETQEKFRESADAEQAKRENLEARKRLVMPDGEDELGWHDLTEG